MKFFKFVQGMCFITVVALIYIYMQMQIFELAYEGKSKEKEIVELSEYNGMLAYKILKLQSASHLGGTLLEQESEFRFRDKSNVVQLVASEPAKPDTPQVAKKEKKVNLLLSLLSLRPEAEARAEENIDLVKPWRRSE